MAILLWAAVVVFVGPFVVASVVIVVAIVAAAIVTAFQWFVSLFSRGKR